MEIALNYKVKQQKKPVKGPLKSISPGAYFRNFTSLLLSHDRGERETSDWWWTARDHGKDTDGRRLGFPVLDLASRALSPSRLPLRARFHQKERRLGTRQEVYGIYKVSSSFREERVGGYTFRPSSLELYVSRLLRAFSRLISGKWSLFTIISLASRLVSRPVCLLFSPKSFSSFFLRFLRYFNMAANIRYF